MITQLKPPQASFNRSLEIAAAVMFGSKTDAPDINIPVEVTLTGQRGQSSQEKLNRDKPGESLAGKPNPQMVDIANMPTGCDLLRIEGSMRILPRSLAPSSTNSHEALISYKALSKAYTAAGGYEVLAARYLENIANGRFGWRNNDLSDKIEVTVVFNDRKVIFDATALEIGEILGLDAVKAACISGTDEDVDAWWPTSPGV